MKEAVISAMTSCEHDKSTGSRGAQLSKLLYQTDTINALQRRQRQNPADNNRDAVDKIAAVRKNHSVDV